MPASTPAERREWAIQELYRRAETPNAEELRPRDVDRRYGTKDGWRIVREATDQFRRERIHPAETASGETP